MYKLRDVKVEARIVDEDDDIRLPRHDILLAERHVAEDRAQMEQHGDETHVSQVLVMAHARATLCCHEVAAKEAELSRSIFLFQRMHQARGMEVSTGLTDNQIVSHCSCFKNP